MENIFIKQNLINWIDALRKNEKIKNMPVLDLLLNNPIVDGYFQRDLKSDNKADASFEKRIAVAAAKMANQYLGLDRETSLKVAEKSVGFIREVRRVYLYEQNRINTDEYNQHKQLSWWAKVEGITRAAYEVGKEPTKKFLKEKGLPWLLDKALRQLPEEYEYAVMRVWNALPAPVQEKIKDGAEKVIDVAVDTIPVIVENLNEGAKYLAKNVTKIVAKGVEKAKAIGKEISEKVGPVVETAKKLISTGFNWLKDKYKEIISSPIYIR